MRKQVEPRRFTFNGDHKMPDDERGPGPSTIERVIGAWQRAQAGLAADDMLVSDETVVSVEIPDIEHTEADVEKIVRRMIRAMLYASLRETEAAEIEKAIKARKLRYKTRGEILRRELFDILTITQRNSVVMPEGTLGLRAIPPSVVILDADVIPDEYMTETTTRTPDKRALKADLDEGVVIAGAVMSNGGTGLAWYPARAPAATDDDADADEAA
jgi:hypothetical protein